MSKLIIESIERDFPLYPLPGKIVDGSDNGMESLHTQNYFQGKTWQQIVDTEFQGYKGQTGLCLGFMSPEAFCYYLPAYLTLALSRYDKLKDSTAYNYTLYRLRLPASEDKDSLGRQFFLDRFDSFSPAQKQAIGAYLTYERRVHGEVSGSAAQEAYNSYWYQFDADKNDKPSPAPDPHAQDGKLVEPSPHLRICVDLHNTPLSAEALRLFKLYGDVEKMPGENQDGRVVAPVFNGKSRDAIIATTLPLFELLKGAGSRAEITLENAPPQRPSTIVRYFAFGNKDPHLETAIIAAQLNMFKRTVPHYA